MSKAHGKRLTALAQRLLSHPASQHDAVLQEMAGELSTIGAQLSKAEGHVEHDDGHTDKTVDPAPVGSKIEDATAVTGIKSTAEATKDESGAYRNAPYNASELQPGDDKPAAIDAVVDREAADQKKVADAKKADAKKETATA